MRAPAAMTRIEFSRSTGGTSTGSGERPDRCCDGVLAYARGGALGLSEDKLVFYDALETNDSAVKILDDETFRAIARELVVMFRNNVTIE